MLANGQQKQNISRSKCWLLGLICCDGKKIACKMWTRANHTHWHTVHDMHCRVPIQTNPGGGQIVLSVSRISKFLCFSSWFLLVLRQMVHKIKLSPIWLSLYTKALQTNKISNSWRARSIRRFYIWERKEWKCCWHQKILSTFSGFCFKPEIAYSLFSNTSSRLISNEHYFQIKFSSKARIWPILTQSLQFKYTLLVTAAQWIDCCPTI